MTKGAFNQKEMEEIYYGLGLLNIESSYIPPESKTLMKLFFEKHANYFKNL